MTRIAILAHSTNPRGGVVHALEVGDALTRLGHEVTVFAPDVSGRGFFRPTLCKSVCFPVQAASSNVREMAEQRIDDYLRYFAGVDCDAFDIWHAQDGISGNVLATLKARRRIPAFVRTVHHVDDFSDARLHALQERSITSADLLLSVSAMWRDRLEGSYGKKVAIVGNGVDTTRFSAERDDTDSRLREQLRLTSNAPVFLAIGGIEERKNTLRILQAFEEIHSTQPTARFIIAGGASLLDHSTYQQRFAQALAESCLPQDAVIRTGPLPQDLMPALYRCAVALVFASVKEGFGLVVPEGMACGTPVIVSEIAPFTEYLAADDVLWCDPYAPASIAAAMRASLDPATQTRLRARGHARVAALGWERVAQAHLAQYANLKEPCDA